MTTGPPPEGSGRPLRADARRNRERLLTAADAVFDELGVGASTEEVARRAGVGIGTLFRHFPTKESLLRAVLVGRMRRLADEARELAGLEDPGDAFFAFFERVVDHAADKTALADALAAAGVDATEAVAEVRDDVTSAITGLLARAQRAGAVRADIGVPEVFALLVGASRAVEHAGDDRGLAARSLAVITDGLRPRGAR